MNDSEMFYDLCKTILQIVHKDACEYRCKSNECVANETRTRMGI